MDGEFTLATPQGEKAIEQNFWIPLFISIALHAAIAGFVGLS